MTASALVAFAANSLLARWALAGELIDPVSFTAIRLASGALALGAIVLAMTPRAEAGQSQGSWLAGFALFVYALGFSLAYLWLNTGMGALLLFATVQITMIGAALSRGDRLARGQWFGAGLALVGLVYLVFPGLEAPNPLGAALMTLAGVAWGLYTLRGKGARMPIKLTSGNFARSLPWVAAAVLVASAWFHWSPAGVGLALVSGVVTSGLGYVIWYAALPALTTTQASVLQLLVPVLAAAAGAVALDEPVTLRLVLASLMILGGVAITVMVKAPLAARLRQ